jgi:hypothetical protein
MFSIDFLMLQKLVEACWGGRTILEFSVLQQTIDVHFHTMSEFHKRAMYNYFNKKYSHESAIMNADNDTIRLQFIERFNPSNQYKINGDVSNVYYLFNARYYSNSRQYVDNEQVLSVEKFSFDNE